MNYKSIASLIAFFAIGVNSYAQDYYIDALRFSQFQPGASARFKALGNAQTSVGGDMSSLSGNPAGLGLFTKSEFSFTPDFSLSSSKSNYIGQASDGSKGKLNINQLGLVWTSRIAKPTGSDLNKGLISLNFGLGYSKTNDFNNKIIYSGTNTLNSIADFYAEDANTLGYGDPNSTSGPEEGTLADAAYLSQLINYDAAQGGYYSNPGPSRNQAHNIIRNGSQGEITFASGINISNKVYFGASLNLLTLNYSSNNIFNERGTLSYSDNNGNYSENYSNNYYQNYETKGSGFNGKFGLIVRPADFIRLGATVQTPSWYSIEDTYSENMRTRLTDNPFFEDSEVRNDPELYPFNYNLKTPARDSFGAALLNGKIGLLTGDVEIIDYSAISLSEATSGDEETIVENNTAIKTTFKNAVNLKLGGELKVNPNIMFRAGYSLFDSPYDNDDDKDFTTSVYSIGGGYRFKNTSIDLAYQTSSVDSETVPYYLNSSPAATATTKTSRNNVYLTVGFRF